MNLRKYKYRWGGVLYCIPIFTNKAELSWNTKTSISIKNKSFQLIFFKIRSNITLRMIEFDMFICILTIESTQMPKHLMHFKCLFFCGNLK